MSDAAPKSRLTDQELIDVSKPRTPYARHALVPSDFTPAMLATLRELADEGIRRALADGDVVLPG